MNKTALHDLHMKANAKMVPFAGYEMPVQYPLGVMNEHLQTRNSVGIFDVSHMGQIIVRPKSGQMSEAALALEKLAPICLLSLLKGKQRYTMLTNSSGGIIDDLMVANYGQYFLLIVNASCKGNDLNHLKSNLEESCYVENINNRSLIALQGPKSESVIRKLVGDSIKMQFMDCEVLYLAGIECWVSRSGYTGEDGFEISIPNESVQFVTSLLLDDLSVELIGLGARDSLRLEAGLCLYGHDIDTQTSPIEASLSWCIHKARRVGGIREGGFPGSKRILHELEHGPKRRRVGILPTGRAPMREGTILFSSANKQEQIGIVSSGGFSPTLERPISMGYVLTKFSQTGTEIFGEVRGKLQPAIIDKIPFKSTNYKK
ncbi:MAG: aminomethyltransferase [Paracoccaceae bacterium]